MLRRLAIGTMLLACAACAGTAAQRATPAARPAPAPFASQAKSPQAKGGGSDPMFICQMERPTGSNIPERVCRRATDAEMQRLRTQDMMRTVPQPQMRSGQ
jgi:hypothetical protein